MLSAQLSGLLVEAARAAEGSPATLTEGPYGMLGGLLIFGVAAFIFVRNALSTLKLPTQTSETNIYADGPVAVGLKAFARMAEVVEQLPPGERRMIELRDHFSSTVETTRKNFYQHVDQRDRDTDKRVRDLEQKVAVLEAQQRQRRQPGGG